MLGKIDNGDLSVHFFKFHLYPTSNIFCNSHIKTRPTPYYSKFAKDQLFHIAYFSPIANDTPVRGPHYCVLKLSICHVLLALIIFKFI